MCRPTRRYDGHPAAIAHWFSTRVAWATHVLMCPATCAGAPDTLCACLERGAPGAAGSCGTAHGGDHPLDLVSGRGL
eukprot:4217803-Pyramimonas_sp.AAC.1